MKRFLAVLAILTALSLPKQKTGSIVIVSQSTVHPSARDDFDPLMPQATLSHLVVENRSYKPVIATLVCGGDEADVKLSARIRLIIDIELSIYVEEAVCRIKSYR
jgi:hypothetical protein